MERTLGHGLIRGNRGFRLFWSARVISFIGDGMAVTALLLYVEEQLGSGLSVAALVLAATVPRLLGPVTGTVADRVNGQRLMVACDIGQGLIFAVAAAVVPPFPVILILVAVASVLATLFRPAGMSAVPRLVGRKDLLAANAWMGMALNLQLALGPVVGGVLFETLGLRGSLALNAVTFLVSSALLTRLRLPAPALADGAKARAFVGELRDGLAFIARHRILRAIVITLFLGVLFASLDNVALVFLAREELGTGGIGFGALASVYGAGMVLAAVALTRAVSRSSPLAYYLVGLVLSGAGTLVTGLSPGITLALVAQAFAGAGNSSNNIGGDTLIQRLVPQAMLGRVFGIVGTSAVLGGSVASLVGGTIVSISSARVAFVVAGGGVLLTACLAAVLVRDRS